MVTCRRLMPTLRRARLTVKAMMTKMKRRAAARMTMLSWETTRMKLMTMSTCSG